MKMIIYIYKLIKEELPKYPKIALNLCQLDCDKKYKMQHNMILASDAQFFFILSQHQ